jgi:copper(I)-binding protein
MNKIILRTFTLVFALAAFVMTATAHEQQHGDLLLHHAWARATPGGAKTGAAYVRIENHGMATDKLIGAAADIAAKVEIHSMSMENDVMVMAPAGEIEIPAHGIVELKPHGLHIMLMGLTQPLKEGDTFAVTLTFEKAGPVDLQIVVEATDSDGSGHDGAEGGGDHTH